MPKVALPNRVASSPFSDSSWITKADEESAIYLCIDTYRYIQSVRAWKSKMPKVALPNRVASSPFSDSSWITKADEERARPPPRTRAAGAERPAAVPAAMKTPEVRRN